MPAAEPSTKRSADVPYLFCVARARHRAQRWQKQEACRENPARLELVELAAPEDRRAALSIYDVRVGELRREARERLLELSSLEDNADADICAYEAETSLQIPPDKAVVFCYSKLDFKSTIRL